MALISGALPAPNTLASLQTSSTSSLPSEWSLPRLTHAEFEQQGQNLLITDSAGHQLLISDYFQTDAPDDLHLGNDSLFRASWIERLSQDGSKLAQAGSKNTQSIGTVENVSGTVTVEHTDGSTTALHKGDPVYQDDILTTGPDGSIGILLIDGTSFSLSGDGKMILDEVIYDPAGEESNGTLSVLNGTFALISGQIAKTAPDALTVNTPSATIGFRGTSAVGNVAPDGVTNVILIADPNGEIGELLISNASGITILNQLFQGSIITSTTTSPTTLNFSANFVNTTYGTAISSTPGSTSYNTTGTDNTDSNTPDAEEGDEDNNDGNDDGDSDPEDTSEPVDDTISLSDAQDILIGADDDSAFEDDLASLDTTELDSFGDVFDQESTLSSLSDDLDNDEDTDTFVSSLESDDTSVTAIATVYENNGSYEGTTYNDTMAFDADSEACGTLYGLAGNDTLTGGVGDDFLYGGDGDDTLEGGDGNDTLYGGSGDDTLIDYTGTSGFIDGGDDNDIIYVSNDFQGSVAGGEGIDILDFGTVVSLSDTYVTANSSGITLSIEEGQSSFTASGIESIVGSYLNDNFTVSTNMTIDGGDSTDTLTIDHTAGVSVSDNSQTVDASDFSVYFSNIETLNLTGYDDTFSGALSSLDTVAMGSGTDTIDLNHLTSSLSVTLGTDVAISDGSNSISVTGAETLTTSCNHDMITVTSDTAVMMVNGYYGTDTLSFGSGLTVGVDVSLDDQYISNSSTLEISYESIETLSLSEYADTITGTSSSSIVIEAADGADSFTYGGGVTTFDGGDGEDTISFGDLDQGISATYNATTQITTVDVDGDATNDISVKNTEVLSGTIYDDIFYGVYAGTKIYSNEGNDTFYTSSGSDYFQSSWDSDTIYVSDSYDSIGGTDIIVAGEDTDSSDIDVLSFTSLTAISGTDGIHIDLSFTSTVDGVSDLYYAEGYGTNLSSVAVYFKEIEVFELSAGDDSFEGSSDNDTVYAGAGDDDLQGYEGLNTLYGEDGNDTLTGGESADILDGGDGNDSLYGASGADTITGGDGDDLVLAASGNDVVDGGSGADSINGSSGEDTLSGGDGDDDIDAGDDNDTLIGGEGNDTLEGGNGADVFSFTCDNESSTNVVSSLGLDIISDFVLDSDTIALDLSVFDYDGAGLTIVASVDTDGIMDSSYGTGHGVVVIEESGDSQLWYFDDLSDTSSDAYQFATLTGVIDTEPTVDITSYAT